MSYVLIVMFATAVAGSGGSTPFVAFQRFETTEACQKALTFVRQNNAYARVECIKDGNDKQTASK